MRASSLHIVERKVKEFMQRFEPGARFLLALSGGADSVALLHALLAVNIDFETVHCNFHLRGDESDRDMAFVEKLCLSRGVKLHLVHFDVEDYRSQHKVSVEMACRELRYDYFRKLCDERGFRRLLTAHHADDNIETSLLNMLRGSGITGLRAMLPDNGETARPLLDVAKSDITDYIRRNSFEFVNDSTNFSSDYRRNFLRNEVLPLLEKEWHGMKAAMTRSLGILRAEDALLKQTLSAYDAMPALPFTLLRVNEAAPIILHSYLRHVELPHKVIAEIIRTVNSGKPTSGKKWNGARGFAFTTSEGVEYQVMSTETPDDKEIPLPPGYECETIENTPATYDTIVSRRDNNTLYLPVPPEEICFRHMRTGDRIYPLGLKGSQLVSRVFKNAKLSLAQKNSIWIAEHRASGDIIWLEGLKRSSQLLIKPDTRVIYRIYRKSD